MSFTVMKNRWTPRGILYRYEVINMAEAKVASVSKTVEYLNRAFQEATRGMPLAQRVTWVNPTERELEGKRHYDWQVEVAYMINTINGGPSYIVPKMVADCNRLIDEVKAHRSQKTTSR
jgi:hypothetical protein